MNYNSFYETYLEHLQKKYPSLEKQHEKLSIKKLVSPYCIPIKSTIIQKAELFIKNIFKLSRLETYKRKILTSDEEILNYNNSNLSLLMAYDFHINPETEEIKLIEINTNGAGYLFVDLLYKDTPNNNTGIERLKESFLAEFQQSHLGTSAHISIADEDLHLQKMFAEFLMYQDLLKSWGFNVSIDEINNLYWRDPHLYNKNGDKVDFIYNRYCDFLLKETKSAEIRKAYLSHQCILSPNPHEYLLLADKQRNVDLTKENWLDEFKDSVDIQILKECLNLTREANSFSKEDLWSQRKKFFFKPQRSFGGKSSYRGRSISKKIFERIFEENLLVQEFTPAPQIIFDDVEWKYDLRFYTYGDTVQQICSRIYQGQVTNFNSSLGGFCPIKIEHIS